MNFYLQRWRAIVRCMQMRHGPNGRNDSNTRLGRHRSDKNCIPNGERFACYWRLLATFGLAPGIDRHSGLR